MMMPEKGERIKRMEKIRHMEKQKKDILDLALYAGEIMLRNGGETYRVEETMLRLCSACGIPTVETFVTPTGIFLSIDDHTVQNATFTFQKRIRNRDIDLSKVSRVNDFSRSFTPGNITMSEAMALLKEIDGPPLYPLWQRSLFAGVASASFAGMFGGRGDDMLCSLLIGIFMYSLVSFHDRLQENTFIKTLLAAAVGSSLAMLCGYLNLCSSTDTLIIGAIMILLPGVAITNAIRDSISGDLLSGMVRAFEAFIIAISIAVGVGLAVAFYVALTGGAFYG